MKHSSRWIITLATLGTVTIAVATLGLITSWPALAEAVPAAAVDPAVLCWGFASAALAAGLAALGAGYVPSQHKDIQRLQRYPVPERDSDA